MSKLIYQKTGTNDINVKLNSNGKKFIINEVRLTMTSFKRKLLYIGKPVYFKIVPKGKVTENTINTFGICPNINFKPETIIGNSQSFVISCRNYKNKLKRFKYNLSIVYEEVG